MKTWGSPFASLFEYTTHTLGLHKKRLQLHSVVCICIHNKHKAAHYIFIYRLIFSAIFPRNGRAIEKFADQNFQIFVFLFGLCFKRGRVDVYIQKQPARTLNGTKILLHLPSLQNVLFCEKSYNISSPRFPVSVFLRFLLVSGAGIKFNR